MPSSRLLCAVVSLVALLLPDPGADPAVAAPDGSRAGHLLRVFLDCREGCRFDFIRAEIPFVDWVRAREGADVHVLVTDQATGAGGRRFVLGFLGRDVFAGTDDTLLHTVEKGEPEERVQAGLARALKLGLVRYLARTPQAETLTIAVDAGAPAPRAAPDSWDSWVFTLRGDGGMELEESADEYRLRGVAAADRVTETWKISVSGQASRADGRYDTDDGDVRSMRTERSLRGLAVRSVGGRFAVGARMEVAHSTYENVGRSVSVAPAAEYNVHHYSEAARRQLRLGYTVEVKNVRYIEETIFGVTSETLARQELSLTLDRREPWGTLRGRLQAGHYLHDPSKYRLDFATDVSLRLTRGLSLFIAGDAALVRDQLSLPARDATTEEILLRQRELSSGYEAEVRVGLSYTFGSMHNNVVNPRFGR